MAHPTGILRYLPSLPILDWGRRYDRDTLVSDLVAALIVTIMLIPQSLAYAMLAGLPPEAGLYASVAPLFLYAIFGTSRALAVGPVAVVSLMTATAIGQHAVAGSSEYWAIALTLACMSGIMLTLMGIFRLGFLANFLSHPVISGFISASALLIAVGQLKTLLGVNVQGQQFFELVVALVAHAPQVHALTFWLGLFTVVFLLWTRKGLRPLLLKARCSARWADMLSKAGPVLAIVATTGLTWMLGWDASGIKIVGTVPQGLPPLTWPLWDGHLWRELAVPAFLIAVVGFVESVSVGQTLAAKRRERIEPNQELFALGASNLSAAMTGGLPVTGGFSRSIVNFDAGAQTPAAGALTAVGILLIALLFTPALYYLPQATLAATIVVAVLSLVDFQVFKKTWVYSKADCVALVATLLGTLVFGVEWGLAIGVGVSLALFLFRTSRPHIAEVGLVPGTESFRNVQRHCVTVFSHVLSLRVDESLYFANSRALEDRINDAVASNPRLEHVVLQCSAINAIDASALESLETIDQRLRASGVALHLSEVKGPVMDKLRTTHFLRELSGQVFLTHYQAVSALGVGTPA